MENLNIESIILTLPQHLQKLLLIGADAVLHSNDETDTIFEIDRSPEFIELCEEIVKKLTPP